jgi:hypothetical protein
MRPSEWINKILNLRNISKPNGQPLYQYRITDEEFKELHDLLKLSSTMGVNHIVHMLAWDACFVFYASEWWRRYYTGQWGWEGIFESIGIDFNELTAGRRNDLIEMGLHRWRRDLRVSDGTRKFLGTIATEGGLPLNQLVDHGGWLKEILRPVLKKHVSRGISIPILIENYRDLIPRSYRSSELDNILSDIIEMVVKLRQEHQLMNKESPLKWLDKNQPGWRENFPLPIDDESGKSLLSDLVDAAAKAKEDEDTHNPFVLERYLIRAESKFPEFVAQLEIPTFVNFQSIGIDTSNSHLPSTYEVEVFEPNGSVWPWCRAISTTYRNKQVLKLSGRSLKLTGTDAVKELRLRFKSMGETFHEIEVLNASYLDIDLPWLFRLAENKWIFYGVASQSVKDRNALAYIPVNQTINNLNENHEIKASGELFNGNIYLLSGSIQSVSEDAKFKLSAGSEETIDSFHLSGKLLQLNSVPREVFIGLPDLIETNLITGLVSRKSAQFLIAKPVGVDTDWKHLSETDAGYFEVRLLDDAGNILLSRRIGILSSKFLYSIKPDAKSVREGLINISGVSNTLINVNNTNVSSSIKSNSSSVDVVLKAEGSPPHSINCSLLAPGHKRDIFLTFPFPSKGALLFDEQGNQVSFSRHFYLNHLMGFRLKVFDEKFHPGLKVTLTFELLDTDIPYKESKDLYIRRKPVLKGDMTEFSIYDWSTIIDSLMSVSTSLDSCVKVLMIMHGQEVFNFRVFRYENEMKPIWSEGAVELDSSVLQNIDSKTLEETYVTAIFLNQPEQQNFSLTSLSSEEVLTGKWLFSPESRQDGPWMIYPLANSKLKFRPLLWDVKNLTEISEEDYSNITTLQKAMGVTDSGLRVELIRNILLLMSSNLDHKSWTYLDNLWKKCSHLPMATFDVWKVAVSEPRFLASLLMRNNDDILEKLELEFPLIWELVRLSEWEASLNQYKEKISINLNDDEELVNELIKKKILKIETLSLSMSSIGGILRFKLLNEFPQELQAMAHPLFMEPLIKSELQKLLQRQSDSEWPELLSYFVETECQKLPNRYSSFLLTYHSFQLSIIFLPLLLAWRTMSSDMEDWPKNTADLFKIKQLKYFDEDWFNTSFQYLSGWLSQQNDLK